MNVWEQLWTWIFELLSSAYSTLYAWAPKIGMAAALLVIGYVAGRIVGVAVASALRKIVGLDQWLEKKGLEKAVPGSASSFLGGLAKWYTYVLFIGAAFAILQIPVVTDFFVGLAMWFPYFIGACIVALIGLLAGEVVAKWIREMNLPWKERIASVFKWGVFAVFAVAALGVAGLNITPIAYAILVVFAAFVIVPAIAIGVGVGIALSRELQPYVRMFLRRALGSPKEEGERRVEGA